MRALLKIQDEKKRLSALKHIVQYQLTVAASENYIDRLLESDKSSGISCKFILKDIRIFYNTIDKALNTVRRAGIEAESDKIENDDSVLLTIRIPKKRISGNSVRDVSRETSHAASGTKSP